VLLESQQCILTMCILWFVTTGPGTKHEKDTILEPKKS